MASLSQPYLGHPKPTARPKGQLPKEELLRKLGPLTLAVIAGTPNGRWSADLSGKTKQSKRALAHLKSALGGHFPTDSAQGQLESRAAALAIVLFEGWRFVLEFASHDQTFALMNASKATHRQRSGMRFVDTILLPRPPSAMMQVSSRTSAPTLTFTRIALLDSCFCTLRSEQHPVCA